MTDEKSCFKSKDKRRWINLYANRKINNFCDEKLLTWFQPKYFFVLPQKFSLKPCSFTGMDVKMDAILKVQFALWNFNPLT